METGYRRPASIPQSKPRSQLLEAALAVLLLLIIAAVLMPVHVGGGPARVTPSISHAKQVGLALVMYEGDYDDLIPYVESNHQLVDLTRPYLKQDDNWQTLNEDRPGLFQLNMSLAGSKVTDLKDPTLVPAVYDPFARRPKNSPEGDLKYLAAFADGHAKAMLAAKWNAAAKYLTLNLKKYGKPLR